MCLQNMQVLQKGKWQLADLGLHLEMLECIEVMCCLCSKTWYQMSGGAYWLEFVLLNDRM